MEVKCLSLLLLFVVPTMSVRGANQENTPNNQTPKAEPFRLLTRLIKEPRTKKLYSDYPGISEEVACHHHYQLQATNNYLCAKDYDNPTIRIIDLQDNNAPLLQIHANDQNFFQEFSLSARGQLATAYSGYCGKAYDQRSIEVWDLAKGSRCLSTTMPDSCYHIVFSPNGNLLAYSYGSEKKYEVAILAADDLNNVAKTIPALTHNHIAFSPDGKHLATGTDNDQTALWDTQDFQSPRVLLLDHSSRNGFKFSPDGSTIALRSGRTINLWNIEDVRVRPKTLIVDTPQIGTRHDDCMDFSPDNRHFAIALRDGIEVHDMQRNSPPAHFKEAQNQRYGSSTYKCKFSPDGRSIIALVGRRLEIHDLEQPESPPKILEAELSNFIFLPTKEQLLTASRRGTTIWQWKKLMQHLNGKEIDEHKE